ncbi:hypothetical protein VP01_2323g4 [Puccinia sorghi]|uniref:Cytochrome b5 heme-binding domain-containing protein n=1 Tax=Puccinia sorghi TaxID=27349 RepID=A0A0L6V899_9BASI|nr:hypothetical protein VP01_2323g4 [Puccinia sorghi]
MWNVVASKHESTPKFSYLQISISVALARKKKLVGARRQVAKKKKYRVQDQRRGEPFFFSPLAEFELRVKDVSWWREPNVDLVCTPVGSVQEVGNHTDEKSAWVIVEGKVYDVTDFLEDHPGGKKILLKNCGKDATELFHQYHTRKILKNVAGPMMIGRVVT